MDPYISGHSYQSIKFLEYHLYYKTSETYLKHIHNSTLIKVTVQHLTSSSSTQSQSYIALSTLLQSFLSTHSCHFWFSSFNTSPWVPQTFQFIDHILHKSVIDRCIRKIVGPFIIIDWKKLIYQFSEVAESDSFISVSPSIIHQK